MTEFFQFCLLFHETLLIVLKEKSGVIHPIALLLEITRCSLGEKELEDLAKHKQNSKPAVEAN